MEKDTNWNLKCTKKSNFELPAIKTISYGLESIRYLGPKIWKLVPDELKEITYLELFKKKLNVLNSRTAHVISADVILMRFCILIQLSHRHLV